MVCFLCHGSHPKRTVISLSLPLANVYMSVLIKGISVGCSQSMEITSVFSEMKMLSQRVALSIVFIKSGVVVINVSIWGVSKKHIYGQGGKQMTPLNDS